MPFFSASVSFLVTLRTILITTTLYIWHHWECVWRNWEITFLYVKMTCLLPYFLEDIHWIIVFIFKLVPFRLISWKKMQKLDTNTSRDLTVLVFFFFFLIKIVWLLLVLGFKFPKVSHFLTSNPVFFHKPWYFCCTVLQTPAFFKDADMV